ncbi:hypothetical protein GBA65_12725 [Rubrobacter marinus]|uniref:Excalibur calcium-binding domain-containing protein n=2 Tax=Rubrobacter marinus TaxID=2653852 RepID=A0A6G8Q2W6_9ACTN|nr:hypothetical protein GBA65_12725 [Rubrobacter marinus]
MIGDDDLEAGQHLLDTFGVDCGLLPLDEPAVQEYAYATEPMASVEEYAASPDGDEGSNDFDCTDFATQEEAQAILDADSADPNRLDEDGDGQACEDSFDGSDSAPAGPCPPGEIVAGEGCVPNPALEEPTDSGRGEPTPPTDQYGQPGEPPLVPGYGENEPPSSAPPPPPPPRDPNDESWTCDEIGGGPYTVPPGSPHDADGDGLACEP